jgi:hypothetical protein
MLYRGYLQTSWALWNLVGRLLDLWFARRRGSSTRRPPLAGPGATEAGVHAPLPRPPSGLLAGAEAQPARDPGADSLYLPPSRRLDG